MNEILDVKYISKYGKVLIVDDEPDLRELVQEILESNHIKVVIAVNGNMALDFLAKEQFDMILCDVQMPEMSGIEFLETVCLRGHHTPLVFYSGYYEAETLRQAVQLGAFDFIAKPVSSEKLLTVVENAAEVGVLQRKISHIKERKNPKLFDFILDYEKRITQLRLMNYSSDTHKENK
jgi:two-component system nitrogen regulation response regulator NtrX